MTKVLFICEDNQMHSQIAECICNLFGSKICSCISAGIELNPKPFTFQKLLYDVYQVELNPNPVLRSVNDCLEKVDIAVIINNSNYRFENAQDTIYWTIKEDVVLEIEEKVMSLLHEIKLGAIE